SPGCPAVVLAAVGTIRGASKLGGRNITKYLHPRNIALREVVRRIDAGSRPTLCWGRPMTPWKKHFHPDLPTGGPVFAATAGRSRIILCSLIPWLSPSVRTSRHSRSGPTTDMSTDLQNPFARFRSRAVIAGARLSDNVFAAALGGESKMARSMPRQLPVRQLRH